MVMRERSMAAAGIVAPMLSGWTARAQAHYAAHDFAHLLAQYRQPPWWSLVGGVGNEAFNLTEYFIHAEDVRRAQPDWDVRTLPDGEQAALWKRVGLTARLLRRAPASVVLDAPGHGEYATGRGGPQVRIIGEPGELLMFTSG